MPAANRPSVLTLNPGVVIAARLWGWLRKAAATRMVAAAFKLSPVAAETEALRQRFNQRIGYLAGRQLGLSGRLASLDLIRKSRGH